MVQVAKPKSGDTLGTSLDTFEENFKNSCVTCGHATVCLLVREINQIFARNFTEDTLPFQPEKLAQICDMYLSNSIVQAVKNR